MVKYITISLFLVLRPALSFPRAAAIHIRPQVPLRNSTTGEGSSDSEKVKAETAKLPPEVAASAEKQKVNPVTNKMLRTMGPPLKLDVNGKRHWIC